MEKNLSESEIKAEIERLRELAALQAQTERLVKLASGKKIEPGSDIAALLKVVTEMAKKKP